LKSLFESEETAQNNLGDTPSESSESSTNLGIALGEKGCWQQAICEFEAVADRNPDHAEAHFNLGLAYAHQGRHEEEIQEYQEAMSTETYPSGGSASRATCPPKVTGTC
jgi:tetratricopeptide (TPR) repeat protein